MMNWLPTICWVSAGLYALLLGIKLLLAGVYVRRQDLGFRTRSLSPAQASSITIIQPILSGDPQLENTLRTNLDQLPREIAFLWLIDSRDHVGLRIGEALAHRYEQVQILQCPDAEPCINPKTFKLEMALQEVRTEYVAVLDDDTLIHSDSLIAAIDALDPAQPLPSQLYTGLPIYRSGSNLWSQLVCHFVNNNSVLTYLPLLPFSPPLSINGMFYVMRTQDVREVGGFAPILTELCDDYAWKKYVSTRGWRVKQGVSIQSVGTSVADSQDYLRLMHRWMLFAMILVQDQTLWIQFVLGILLGLPPLLLWLAILSCWTNWTTMLAILALLFWRQLVIMLCHRRVLNMQVRLRAGMSILAELLQPIQTLHALLDRTIVWRRRTIRVQRGMRFEKIGEQFN